MNNPKFKYVNIPATGNRKVSGAILEQMQYTKGWGQYHVNGQPIEEVLRQGNNSYTAGGASSVGYQIQGKPETRQKSMKKLIDSLK